MSSCSENLDAIFRAYDIRGIFDKDLRLDTGFNLGKAIGRYFGPLSEIIVARDVRTSSMPLTEHLVRGLLSSGVDVLDIGAVPSPVLYFTVKNLKKTAGVMVTASHLPPEWNGFKICDGSGMIVSFDSGLNEVKRIMNDRDYIGDKEGKLRPYEEAIGDYVKHISSQVSIDSDFSVTVDFGNSVTALVVPRILSHFGIRFKELNRELKGQFLNRESELSEKALESLREELIKNDTKIGIAYDGDGDRVAFIDEKRKVLVNGNSIIPVYANYYLKNNKGRSVVIDITCSGSVTASIKECGGVPIISRVGHSNGAILARENSALFSAQYSGHISFAEMGYSDDAIYSSMKMIEIIQNSGQLSDLATRFPKYSSTAIHEVVADDTIKFEIVERCKKLAEIKGFRMIDTDGIKILNEETDSWVLIRPSNTSPIIRVNADGPNDADTVFMEKLGLDLLNEAMLDD